MLDNKAAQTHEELQNRWMDPYMQWYAAGMPAFITDDLSPYKQIIFKFKTMEDRQAFAELIGQQLTEKTNVIWYPEKKREKNIMSQIVEDQYVR